ncbi:MAG: hypothetical protein EOM87_08515, partial [Clostridia bacterium]|nr:hypothetical protein [Clostridia bacterium]
HALIGWYKDNSFTDEWEFENDKGYSDMTLYAQWAQADTSACSVLVATDFTLNEELYIKVPNAQDKFSFLDKITVSPYASWKLVNDLQGGEEVSADSIDIAEGDNVKYILVTAYDGLTHKYYKVTISRRCIFNVSIVPNNGEETIVLHIEEDSSITPPELIKSGYTIKKWLNGDDEWNIAEDDVKTDMTLSVQWKANTYIVSFDSDEGSEIEDESIVYDSEFNFTVPEKLGYTFIAWNYLDEENEVISLTDGTGACANIWNIDTNITAKAKWTPTIYQITYDNVEFAENDNPSTYTVETYVIFNDASKAGYDFVKWQDIDGTAITEIALGSIGDITISSEWSAIEYTATFKVGNNTIDTKTFTLDDTLILTPTIPEKTGYTSEWESYLIITDDIEINAIYTPIQYNINYFNIVEVQHNNPVNYTIETATFELKVAEKSGYSFVGWYDQSLTIQTEEIIHGSFGNISLYAIWTAKNNTVVFNGNGSTGGSMSNQTIATDATAALSANAFAKTGYAFAGWATTSAGSVVYADEADYTMGTDSSYTLYAIWTANNNTVVFNGNGSTNGSMSNQTIATDATAALS